MELLCITDAVKQFGVTSKTLRYYEHVGLLEAKRADNNNYRYYDESEIERIKQIMILRKMQISIKDIIRIFENEDMSTVVEVFVNRINALDEEVGALTELRRITNEFLQTMVKNGIKKISALPLLYEEMDKQIDVLEEHKPVTYSDLETVNEKLRKEIDISIIILSSMRMLSSKRKDNGLSDIEGFTDWAALNGLPNNLPGSHDSFEYQDAEDETVFLRKIDSFLENNSPYIDIQFEGGLFAAGSVYVDDDIGAFHRSMINSFGENPYYKVDYKHDGTLRHETLLEMVISPDDKREKINIYLAVKKRLPNELLYDPIELMETISIGEIENANPDLWTKNVSLPELIPESMWCDLTNEHGEKEHIPFITRNNISTGIKVKLPFRVDIEFMLDDSTASYAYGNEEGSICFYHGKNLFGINKGNYSSHRDESIIFNQPILRNSYHYPTIGKVDSDVYNRLSWVVGQNHFAVIINDEVRYCGVNFPYMKAEWHTQQPQNISITSSGDGKKYIKSIRVSQLKENTKKIKKGALTMNTKQSNNIIPIIHQLISSDHGENYWFNGCAKYVMECLNEPDYDYWFFAGLNGDNFAQNYALNGGFLGDGVMDFLISSGSISPKEYFENLFRVCGYASTYVDGKELRKNTKMYLQTMMAYIDKSVPVILHGGDGSPFGVFVGYEERGKVLLYLTGNETEPQRMPIETAIGNGNIERFGWIFVGEKQEQKKLKQIYRDVIIGLPQLLTTKTDKYCFGAEAFRAWAAEIENGKFDGMKPEQFDGWRMYSTYVCCLATNSGGCRGFLKKAQELNPDFTFLEDVRRQYRITGFLWDSRDAGWHNGTAEYMQRFGELPDSLESIGGGFNITLEALQNPEKRSRITTTILKFADCMDEVVRIIKQNIKTEVHHA